ncbi:hypothetical protein DXG01_001504 [Tephrocybe rancida]|nr:hypothetical protein DXG01_001504 [Tephrocybe rancida]
MFVKAPQEALVPVALLGEHGHIMHHIERTPLPVGLTSSRNKNKKTSLQSTLDLPRPAPVRIPPLDEACLGVKQREWYTEGVLQ